MGCDIHMHVEYNMNGKWMCGDYFSLDSISTLDNPKFNVVGFYSNRNYSLFAVLADVRNSDCVEYIDTPRGLPDDAHEFTKSCYDAWSLDAHSCSYFTLKELIDFDDEILDPIIEKLKVRADELNLIYDFTWEYNYNKAYESSDNIRIVFWFDN